MIKIPGVGSITAALAVAGTIFFAPAATGKSDYDVSGNWRSNWGTLQLSYHGNNPDNSINIVGYWDQGPGKRGLVQNGSYNPNKGVLTFDYFQPWNNQNGSAHFLVDSTGTSLNGTWKQGSGSGTWNLTRSVSQSSSTVNANSHAVDGRWNSDWGPFQISSGAIKPNGTYNLSGTWDQGKGKIGQIIKGQYRPNGAGGIVTFKYYLPWKGINGSAKMTVSNDGQKMAGTWVQPDGQGNWTLTR